MTKEECKKLIAMVPIMRAYVDGEEIEYRHGKYEDSSWFKINDPEFSKDCIYRVKPKPQDGYCGHCGMKVEREKVEFPEESEILDWKQAMRLFADGVEIQYTDEDQQTWWTWHLSINSCDKVEFFKYRKYRRKPITPSDHTVDPDTGYSLMNPIGRK